MGFLMTFINTLVIFVPSIREVFGIIGATASTMLVFVLPSVFYLKLDPRPYKTPRKLSAIFMVTLGTGLMIQSLSVIIAGYLSWEGCCYLQGDNANGHFWHQNALLPILSLCCWPLLMIEGIELSPPKTCHSFLKHYHEKWASDFVQGKYLWVNEAKQYMNVTYYVCRGIFLYSTSSRNIEFPTSNYYYFFSIIHKLLKRAL